MKETLKNEILGEILEMAGLTTDVQIIVERLNKKQEIVEISVVKNDGRKDIIITKETNNGFMWAAALIMTLAKIKGINTTILITSNY